MLIERKVEYLKWEQMKKADVIAGFLISMQATQFEGKRNVQFTLQNDAGLIFKLFGTRELLDKLHPTDIGHFVQLTYQGSEALPGDRKTHHIAVAVDSEKKRNVPRLPPPEAKGPTGEPDPFQASDDDIPF